MCFKILSGASGTDFKDLDVGTTLGGEATAVYFHVLQPLHFSARVTVDLTQKLSITPYHCCGVFRQTGLQGGSSRGEFCFQNKWKFYEAFVLLCEDIYWNWKVPGRTSAEFNSKPWEVLPVGRRNNLDLENKEFIISNDQNDSPGRTCSHADCMAWRVSPAWLLSATQMYSPASSSVTLDKWRVLVLEELLCRGCMRKTLSQRQKSCKSAFFFCGVKTWSHRQSFDLRLACSCAAGFRLQPLHLGECWLVDFAQQSCLTTQLHCGVPGVTWHN